MVKVYVPRRIIERNRWLRSDGKPNFKDRIYAKPPELEAVADKKVPLLSMQATIINACEVMSSLGTR
ncbi:MAG: histidine kinase, partial [Desulfurococcales archaeon]|nr:histidine kinase [Desulfurococcales archaeon]